MGGTVSSHNSSNSYCPRDGATNGSSVNAFVKPTAAGNGAASANGANGNNSPDARTAFELFLLGCAAATESGAPCLGSRADADSPYVYQTYQETLVEVRSMAAYLSDSLGLRKGDFVGTLASNCAQLAALELACYSMGLVLVPIYDTLGREACGHILEETGLRVLFCRSAKQLDTLMELASDLGSLKVIVTDADAAVSDRAQKLASLDSYADAVAKGRAALDNSDKSKDIEPASGDGEAEAAGKAVQAEDLAVICYTSGTTGRPKGVMLTNGNLAKGVYIVKRTMMEDTFRNPVQLNSSDAYFSYLPMAHILERMCQLFAFTHGVSVGFFRGDRATFMDDLRQCRPTFLAAVPKVLSRVRERAMAAVAGSRLKAAVLSAAISRKGRQLAELRIERDTVWDRLVLRRVQDGLGGRLRFVAVGGAPISPETLHFVKAALGCPVVQGFGQTETSGLGLCQRPGDPASDHTGATMLGVEAKLADAPDADCHDAAATGLGELCIRGPTCFAGYYKQPERTAEVLDSDGWVHTGDIAKLLPDGTYRVVDRVKHLFKLAQGEYIAPEKVELTYCLCPMVDQVFVDGRSERSCLLAVVVPTVDAAKAWQQQQQHQTASSSSSAAAAAADADAMAAACASAEFKAQLLAAMHATGKQRSLQGFEQVKDILLHPEPFTAENDLMTPTLKLKRPQLRKRFAAAFDTMYLAVEG